MYRHLILSLLVVLFSANAVVGQSVDELLSNYFSSFKENRLEVSVIEKLGSTSLKMQDLKSFQDYDNFEDESVRAEAAYRLLGGLLPSVAGKSVQSSVLKIMLSELADSSSELS